MGGARILESDEAVRLFDEYGSDFLSVHAPDGTYLYASKASQRLFGWEPDALVGRNAYAYFHPDDIERIRRDHAKHESAEPGAVQYRLRCGDQRWCWVETRSRAQSEGGNIIAITRDVHRQVLAEQRRRAVVESMAAAVAHEVSNPLTIAELSLSDETSRGALQRLSIFLRELRLLGQEPDAIPQALDLRRELARVQGKTCHPEGAELLVRGSPSTLRQLLFLLAYDSVGTPTHPEIGEDDDGVWIRLRVADAVGDPIHADLRSAMEGTVKLSTRLELLRDLRIELGLAFELGSDGLTTFRFPPPTVASER